MINPPGITLNQKMYMVYSFTFYAALDICCHFIYLVIWSWATGQVSHAFIIYWTLSVNLAVVVLLNAYCCCCAADCILLLLHIQQKYFVVVYYQETYSEARTTVTYRCQCNGRYMIYDSLYAIVYIIYRHIYIYEKTYCEANKLLLLHVVEWHIYIYIYIYI